MSTAQAAGATVSDELLALAAQLEASPGLREAVERLQEGQSAAVGGVWGSSCALAVAALLRSAEHPLLVVTAREKECDTLESDLALFTRAPVVRLPAWESEGRERLARDEVFGGRLRALKRLSGKDPTTEHAVVVASIQSLMQPVPSRDDLAAATRRLAVEQTLDADAFCAWLAEGGFQNTTAVELPGEFARRGGIIDVFAPDADHPVRLELFGDELESIRGFDVATQRSIESLTVIELTAMSPGVSHRTHATAYLPEGAWVALVEPQEIDEQGRHFYGLLEDPSACLTVGTTVKELTGFTNITIAGVPAAEAAAVAHARFESVERFSGEVQRVREELETAAGEDRVYLIADTEAEMQRLGELFAGSTLADSGRLRLALGRLERGFRAADQGAVLISAAELFHRSEVQRPSQRKLGRAIDSFLELRQGDLVVHLAHGIGRYRGLKLIQKEAGAEEHLELEYFGGTRVYVPTSKIDLVQKYVGGRKAKPNLAKIGGAAWAKQKQAAERAVTDLAAEMLELQAARESRPGIAFPGDTPWQAEFDAAFPYQETDDQLAAIDAIKEDMTAAKPMDRLLCGDVGFGKTEVAMRAAFKAIDAGYQVAVLVPTTVLAEQHRRTFSERMAEFPFEIASLSRFSTTKQTRETLQNTVEGKVDLVIGTHRLVSPDVEFQNLGLIVIDEEQRFGVQIKERLKALRASVDVLTMTATPIPRTLHLSLLGVRSISNLETAPKDRVAVETRLTRFNEETIRHAVLRELNRDGQVYFVHNRVHDIQKVAHRLQQIVPEASLAIGHGQMNERELEEVMLGFVRHDFDILLATTIVESGLDIPNANTIFIDDADRYGLADLHQLRGRVGRYKHRAYCYLLIGEDRQLSPEAARRLRAIEEFSEMGAGFALAMRDLELRGAGNILGTQQSGHIATVGYELYCALLERAVRELRKLPPKESIDVAIELPAEAYLPDEYIGDRRTKVDLYRRLARVPDEPALDEFAAELEDRFGPLPEPVAELVQLARLRVWSHGWAVSGIRVEGAYLVLEFHDERRFRGVMQRAAGRLRLADDTSAYLPLKAIGTSYKAMLAALKPLLRPAAGGS